MSNEPGSQLLGMSYSRCLCSVRHQSHQVAGTEMWSSECREGAAGWAINPGQEGVMAAQARLEDTH